MEAELESFILILFAFTTPLHGDQCRTKNPLRDNRHVWHIVLLSVRQVHKVEPPYSFLQNHGPQRSTHGLVRTCWTQMHRSVMTGISSHATRS